MSQQYATDGKLGVNTQRIDDSTTSPIGPAFPLGTKVATANGGEWIYCQLPAIAQIGSVCVIDPTTWIATLISTANSNYNDPIGVAPALATVGQYGWLQTKGEVDNVYVGLSAAANAKLNTTATAGMLDDDGGAGSKNTGISITTARPAGSNGVEPGYNNGAAVGSTN